MEAFARDWMNRVMHDAAYVREYYGVRPDAARRGLGARARKLGTRFGLVDSARGKTRLPAEERLGLVTDHLGLGADRIARFDHHLCHAAAAYLGAPFAGAPALVLTNDNSGDGLCATASTGRGVTLTRREATPSAPGSIGAFYSLVTLLLGMKPGEHVFKVMGLSAYAPGPARGPAALALGGGVFMNILANMRLASEDWVRDLFVFPSCGDESNAIGAAYLGYLEACRETGAPPAPRPFGPGYLGPDVDETEVEAVIRAR